MYDKIKNNKNINPIFMRLDVISILINATTILCDFLKKNLLQCLLDIVN